MKRVAMCIPTYEKDECIRDMLESCMPYYLQYGIDIIFYDSSPNDKTEKLVCEEYSKYGERLQYNKVPFEMRTNEKVFKMYQGYGYQPEKYDYIWVCSDAVQFTESAVKKICKILEGDYDVVVNDPYNNDGVGSKEYRDPNVFFGDCAWGRGGITLLGATILNIHTLLQGVEWNKYEQYLDDQIICFSHLSFIFNRILEIRSFKGYHLALENREYRSSVYKKTSSWYYYAFSIVCGQYVKAVDGLPESYNVKKNVIRKYGETFGLGSIRRFLEFRMENVINLQIFVKYFREWKLISSINRCFLFTISILPKSVCKKICYRNNKKLREKFDIFIQRHEQVWIYGAGRVGTIYANFFDKEQINFLGFCVSDTHGKNMYLDYPLCGIDEVKGTSQTGIIIAMQEENAKDVLRLLKKQGRKEENLFYSQDFYKMISFELGYRD